MRRIPAILLCLIFGTGVFALDPDELNNVAIFNNSGGDIVYLFLSPGDSEYWGPDILGSERTLEHRSALGFYIHYPDACNTFDFMAIDSDGNAYVKWDVEICDESEATISITGQDLSDSPPEVEYISLEIVNNASYDMWFVFLSPADSNMWGVDLLDEESILEAGASAEFLVPIGSQKGTYDFLGVDEDNDDYRFSLEIDPAEGDELFVEITDDDYSEE